MQLIPNDHQWWFGNFHSLLYRLNLQVEATYLATVTGTAVGLSRSTGVNYVVKPTPTSTEYVLSWEGYDWDGGGEETIALNGQFIASIPIVPLPGENIFG